MTELVSSLSARLRNLPVLVVGRAGMDLYPVPDGARTETAETMNCDVGGSAGNIAVAYARQGGRAQLMSGFSGDSVGRFVRRRLEGHGVDLRHCRDTRGLERTSLALAESTTDAPNVVIYRNDAADLAITEEDARGVDVEGTAAIVITGTALSREPSRSACRTLIERAGRAGCPVALDLDFRVTAWQGEAEARDVLGDAAELADMPVGNDEEFDLLGAGKGGRGLAAGLAEKGALVLYKMGEAGCDVLQGTTGTHVGIYAVDALKPFGAGDAFMGGVLAGLGRGDGIEAAVRRGAASASIVVSRRGCASAMPDAKEVDAMMATAATS